MRLVIRLVVSILLFVSGSQALVADPTPAGSLGGSFNVDRNGRAAYRVPLHVPPGIQSMQPNLALSYNSQGGNGKVGMGFSLSGLSTIQRCKAILAIDGFSGTIAYDADDRLCLDGERLINITDNAYQSPSAIYHTERETWSKVVPSYEGCTVGPCSFTVTHSDGTVRTYGTSTDSRILADGAQAVRVWALHQRQDLDQNTIVYSYTQSPTDAVHGGALASPGAYYVDQILYTSNSATSFTGTRTVSFAWTARPDIYVHYVGGSEVTVAARLIGVTTKVGSTVAADYRLTYETAPAPGTARSRLASVQRCDDTGTSAACLPATSFGRYQDLDPKFTGRTGVCTGCYTANQGWGDESKYPRTSADVNGDGRTDLVGFGDANGGTGFNGVQVALSKGASFDSPSKWADNFAVDALIWLDQSKTPRFVTDVNADGLQDLLGFGSDGVHVGLSNGSTFDTSSWNGGQPYTPFRLVDWDPSLFPRVIGDVDGDHLVDLIGFKDGAQVALSSQGNGFAALDTWIGDFSYQQGWTDLTPRMTADVNGDGRADIIGFNVNGVEVGLSTGSGFTKTGWDQSYSYYGYNLGWDPSLHPRLMTDVNGDGLADIVGFRHGTQVGLSTGKGFLPPTSWNPGFSFESSPSWTSASDMPRKFSDVNGDGLSDIVGFNADDDGAGKVVVALSTGNPSTGFTTSGWDQGSLPNLYQNGPVMISDVTGNGLADPTNFAQDGVYSGLAAGPVPDLLTQVTDGIGARHTVVYGLLSQGAPLYTDDNTGSTDPDVVSAVAHSTAQIPIGVLTVPSYPNQRVRGDRRSVVATYTLSNDSTVNGSPFSYQHGYTYKNASLNLRGRGWLGFGEVTSNDMAAGERTTRSYHIPFPFTGKVVDRDHSCLAGPDYDPSCTTSGTLLRQTTKSYLCEPGGSCDSADQAIFQPYPKVFQILRVKLVDQKYHYGTKTAALGTEWDFELHGHPIRVAYLGYLDPSGNNASPDDDVYTFIHYTSDDTANIFGKPMAQLVSNHDYGTWAGTTCDTAAPTFDGAHDLSLEAMDYTQTTWNVHRHCRWDDTANQAWLTTSYGFDPYGNRTMVTPPGEGTTHVTFDGTYHTYRDTLTTPPNHQGTTFTMKFGYDPRTGVRVAHRDFSGNTHTSCVDGFGRTVTWQGPAYDGNTKTGNSCLGSAPVSGGFAFVSQPMVTLSTQQWVAGGGTIYRQLDHVLDWPTKAVPTPPTTTSKFFIDALHRTVQSRIDSPTDDIVTCTQWTSRNKSARRSMPFYSNTAVDCSQDNAAPHWSITRYDAYNRRLSNSSPVGDGSENRVITWQYAGTTSHDTVTETQASTQSYAFATVRTAQYFDNQQRVVTLETPDDTVTHFGFDPLGRATSHVDPAGVTETITLDSLGRKVKIESPSIGTHQYTYADNGKLHTRVGAGGTVTYGYDPWGRVLTQAMSHPHDTSLDRTFTFQYDDETCGANADELTLATVTATTGNVFESSKAYCYDSYGNHKTLTTRVGSDTYRTDQVFDPRRRRTLLTYPDGGDPLVYAYQKNLLHTVSLGKTVWATYDQYSPFGQAGRITVRNGVVDQYGFGPSGELLSHELDDSGGTAIVDHTLTWDHLTQLGSITAAEHGGTSQSFTYQNRRLHTASGPWGSSTFTYQPNGNMKTKDDWTFVYDGQQATSATDGSQTEVWSAGYDDAGRMHTRTYGGSTSTYTFDALDRLVSVAQPSVTTTFTYSAHGQRLRKSSGGDTITYVGSAFETTRQASGTVLATRYVVGPSGRIASITTSTDDLATRRQADTASGTPAPGTVFLHNSYLDSTRVTTDATGKALSTAVYTPYGTVHQIDGPDNFRYKYTSKELDADTGLYNYGRRYYDPIAARFISADKGLGGHAHRQDALNRYEYVFSNPSSYNDPTGAAGLSAAAAVGCGGAAVANAALGLGWANYVQSHGKVSQLSAAGLGLGTVAAPTGAGVCIYNLVKAARQPRAGRGRPNDGNDSDGSDSVDGSDGSDGSDGARARVPDSDGEDLDAESSLDERTPLLRGQQNQGPRSNSEPSSSSEEDGGRPSTNSAPRDGDDPSLDDASSVSGDSETEVVQGALGTETSADLGADTTTGTSAVVGSTAGDTALGTDAAVTTTSTSSSLAVAANTTADVTATSTVATGATATTTTTTAATTTATATTSSATSAEIAADVVADIIAAVLAAL
ncbi:MAG: RHS repeat-associated core domain-containing protein [Acidobacteriota bacterium]